MNEMTQPDNAVVSDQPATRIVLVEDERLFAKAVVKRLEQSNFDCVAFEKLADAASAIPDLGADVILLDMRLPDGSGLDFLARLRREFGLQTPVIVMTAYGEVDDAVTAMKLSAADYLKKPVDLDELMLTIDKVLSNDRVSRQLEYSKARESNADVSMRMIGDSPSMVALKGQIDRIAALTNANVEQPPTVFITGETGTGKDVTARELHRRSSKASRPFVHVDCASLPKDLIEAELFGHVKGAFTNAHAERTGLIEAAEDGVVFLDEIGEVPLELQSKLLAVLERRKLRRVGSSQERPVNAWFIAATNRAVEQMVSDGLLRSDLYFRLNVMALKLPALRERGDDVLALANHFGRDIARRYGMGAFELSHDAREAIKAYAWPGNVRELRHVIERATLLCGGKALESADLLIANSGEPAPGGDEQTPTDEFASLTLDEAERVLIERALQRCDNNVSAAARALGVTRMAMRYRMKKYGMA